MCVPVRSYYSEASAKRRAYQKKAWLIFVPPSTVRNNGGTKINQRQKTARSGAGRLPGGRPWTRSAVYVADVVLDVARSAVRSASGRRARVAWVR